MKFWQVDAFTDQVFGGNPAVVFVVDVMPDEGLMQKIANEMNVSETAFVILGEVWTIRWFTPNSEVKLCGHATLAAAHVLWEQGIAKGDEVTLASLSGPLTIRRGEDGYTMDFPLQPASEKVDGRDLIEEMVGAPLSYLGSNDHDCMAVIEDGEKLFSFVPDFGLISQLDDRGFLLTAPDPSGQFDYICRAFFPKLDVLEDPVTGSANTCLAEYWSRRLGNKHLRAKQVSLRGGILDLEVDDARILITGRAVTVFEGVLAI
ncbi:MAG: putative isomerase YddE [Chlamydiia bacterium]|nr:putative isomerase YddE [Chlamydiia bacterium]